MFVFDLLTANLPLPPRIAEAAPLVPLMLTWWCWDAERHPVMRLGAWLFGALCAYQMIAGLGIAAVTGKGDWATVLSPIAPASVWRPGAAIVGVIALVVAGWYLTRSLRSILRAWRLAAAFAATR